MNIVSTICDSPKNNKVEEIHFEIINFYIFDKSKDRKITSFDNVTNRV